jgi:probable F420-dependent oxidoreductase
MRLAIVTPVLTMMPGAHARWEETGTIADVARIATTADSLGYDHLTCSEHIGVPAGEAPRRGATYWDPLATFGYLSAVTQRIRLATNILVLGYHHPLAIAKRYGTLDVVSGGRLVLGVGVGVGTLREEFELLGVPFDGRGEIADDALRALRASLSRAEPSYDGPHFSFGGLVIDPCAVQPHVPIWVGGRTLRSLRRAVELGDGWTPFAVAPDQVKDWLARFDVPAGFEVVLPPPRAFDPVAAPEAAVEELAGLADAGATIAKVSLVHHSLEHYLDQLAALADLARLTSGS